MNDGRRAYESDRMHSIMESLGNVNDKKHRNDEKTKKAYENFKRPVWYLRDNKNDEKTK